MGSEKIKAFFDKLPFQKWVTKAGEKIPFFTKIIPFANYIGSGISVLLLIGIINLAIPNGPTHTIKYLKSINNSTSRYWVEFIKKNGINAINAENNSILLAAIKSNNPKLVEACLKDGAEPNHQGKESVILHARSSNNPEICELCLKYGADLSTADPMNNADFYYSDLDDVFIPYYKKQKLTDFTKKNAFLLTDSSPLRVAKLADAGFMFSYYDMTVLAMEYLNSYDDEIAAKTYMNALKNNCNHKFFLTDGVFCTEYDKDFNFAHEILAYLKIQANRYFTAENIEMIIEDVEDPDSDYSRYKMKYLCTPLYDIYTTNPEYNNQALNEYYKNTDYGYNFKIVFEYIETEAYRHLLTMNSELAPMFNRNHPGSILSKWHAPNIVPDDILRRIHDKQSLSTGKNELAAFYADPNIQKQKEQFITLINFFEEQGY